MNSERRQHLVNEVRRLDAGMRRLADLAIDLHRPARELMADLRARRDKMRRQHDTLEATQREADRLLLADLIDLYINGGDADREWLRNLLSECRTFRWGFGWCLGMRIATAEEARKALAVFSMRDGGSDYRDQIVALEHICHTMQAAGLPVAALLTEAAGWSSVVQRFPPVNSTRALLLRYAERFAPPVT
jgi:hypothetical protein